MVLNMQTMYCVCLPYYFQGVGHILPSFKFSSDFLFKVARLAKF